MKNADHPLIVALQAKRRQTAPGTSSEAPAFAFDAVDQLRSIKEILASIQEKGIPVTTQQSHA